jgi:hypothetical protein
MKTGILPSSRWSFLVARGRHQGYQSILVPDFLARAGARSVLPDAVRTGEPGGQVPITARIATPNGPMVITYRTHRLTYADLVKASDETVEDRNVEHSPEEIVTDDNGRPLDLLYGYVSRAKYAGRNQENDLRIAYAQALDAYRSFFADETVPVQISKPLPASFVRRRRSVRRWLVVAIIVGLLAVITIVGVLLVQRSTCSDPACPSRLPMIAPYRPSAKCGLALNSVPLIRNKRRCEG